jgi:hypothetical protein
MLRKADCFKLHFGPYRTPRFKYGSVVQDEIRGEVKVVGLKNARIPWPIGLRERGRALVIMGDLARAVRWESALAISYWWGVWPNAVTAWRKALGIPLSNEGTHRLRNKYTQILAFKRNLRKAVLMSNGPEQRAKIAAALKGRKRPEHAIRAVSAAHKGRPRSEETRRKISEALKRRGIIPTRMRGPLWSAEEDGWVRTLSPSEAVRKTGRTKDAVYLRRRRLKLTTSTGNQGKRRAAKPRKARSV